MIFLYAVLLVAFSVYSYALMDPNITLFNSPVWAFFREKLIYFGYYQRPLSTFVYLLFVVLLFAFHIYFVKKKKTNPVHLSLVIGGVLLFSYPFLSHDFFNYLFDEKILTFYHQNPYLHKALDFPHDNWTRFMHWTHRTYPYGPTFLLMMLPASVLSFGKFILAYMLGKMTFAGCYILSVYLLNKMSKWQAIFFATNPLILVEGLMNLHNDFIAVALGIIGLHYLSKKPRLIAGLFFLLSAGIKYFTVPILLMLTNYPKKYLFAGIGILLAVLYVSATGEVQPWYFLNLFVLYPFFSKMFKKFNFLFAGLLVSYYPFVLYGDWTGSNSILIKHVIIAFSAMITIIWLAKEFRFITITKE